MIAPQEYADKVKHTYGRTVAEILAKAPQLDRLEILGAIETLVGSKIRQSLPTTLAERMVFAFKWLAVEVNNGGFHQYFFNSAGDFWKDAHDGLIAIGDSQGLARFKRVLAVFPESAPSPDRYTRQDQLEAAEERDEEALWKHFEDSSREYYDGPFPNWDLLYQYVQSHSAEFDFSGA